MSASRQLAAILFSNFTSRFLFLLFMPSQYILAQDSICGFNFHSVNRTAYKEKIPGYFAVDDMHQLELQSRTTATVPIVIHVLWHNPEDNIPTEIILEELEILNEIFINAHSDLIEVPDKFKSLVGNPALHFCLASVDPDGHPTSGIVRVKVNYQRTEDRDSIYFSTLGGSSAWNTHRYLNIWMVNDFGYTGWSSFPEEDDTLRDGIIIKTSIVNSLSQEYTSHLRRLLVHEIGHYLGLHHIWGDEPTNPQCVNDDGIADTPIQRSPSGNCPDEDESPTYSCGHNNMYVNFMDYTPAECSLMFTQQQAERMHNVLNTYRVLLLDTPTHCTTTKVDEQEYSFTLFPNPVNNEIFIHLTSPFSFYEKLEIIDLNGRMIWNKMELVYDGMKVVLTEIPSGLYVLKIGSNIQKFVIL